MYPHLDNFPYLHTKYFLQQNWVANKLIEKSYDLLEIWDLRFQN